MTYAWFDIGDGRQVYRKVPEHNEARSDLPRPYVASDTMEPVQSMLDGKYYTSKSLLRRTYREAGVVEVGNDPARLRPKKKEGPDRQAIRQSLKKATEIVASR